MTYFTASDHMKWGRVHPVEWSHCKLIVMVKPEDEVCLVCLSSLLMLRSYQSGHSRTRFLCRSGGRGEGDNMTEQSDPHEFEGYKEALWSQVFTLDALIILLERKGVITREEVIEEIEKLHEEALTSG